MGHKQRKGFALQNFSAKNLGGFTLIEILIVVAIIGVLASAVLVGLGPAQQRGRDARRISDLRNIQTGLELYFTKCGFYPGGVEPDSRCMGLPGSQGASVPMDITVLEPILIGSGLSISNIPDDPDSSRSYVYSTNDHGSEYVLMAQLDYESTAALNDDSDGTILGVNCDGPNYCVQF